MRIGGRGQRAVTPRRSARALVVASATATASGAGGRAASTSSAAARTAAAQAQTVSVATVLREYVLEALSAIVARVRGSSTARLQSSSAYTGAIGAVRAARAQTTAAAAGRGRSPARARSVVRAEALPGNGGTTPTWMLQAPTTAQVDGPVANPFTMTHVCGGGVGCALAIFVAVRLTQAPAAGADWTITWSQAGAAVQTAQILRTDIGDEAGDTAYVQALVNPATAGVGTIAVDLPGVCGDLIAFAFDVKPAAGTDVLGKAAGGLRDAPVASISYSITPTQAGSLLLAFAGSREAASEDLTWSAGLTRLTRDSVPSGSTGLGVSIAYMETTGTAPLTITATFPDELSGGPANDAWMKVVELRPRQATTTPPTGVVTFDQTADPIIIPPDSRWLSLPYNGWWLGPQAVASLSVGNSLLGSPIDLDPSMGKDSAGNRRPYTSPRKPPVTNGVQADVFSDREGMMIFRSPDEGELDCVVFWLKGNTAEGSPTNNLSHVDGPDYEWGRNKPRGFDGNATIKKNLYLSGPYSIYWGGKYKYELWSLKANKTKDKLIATSETLDGYVRRLNIALGVGDATFLGLRWLSPAKVQVGRDYAICVVNTEPGTSGGASFNDAREYGSCPTEDGRTYIGPFWRAHLQNYVGGGIRPTRHTFFLMRIAGRWRGNPYLAGFNNTTEIGAGSKTVSNRVTKDNSVRQVFTPMKRPDGTGEWRAARVWVRAAKVVNGDGGLEARIRRLSDDKLLAGPVTWASADFATTAQPFTTSTSTVIPWRSRALSSVLELDEDVPIYVEFTTSGASAYQLAQIRDESLAQYRMRPGAGQALVPIQCQESCGNVRGATRKMYAQIKIGTNGDWVNAGYRGSASDHMQWLVGLEMERKAS